MASPTTICMIDICLFTKHQTYENFAGGLCFTYDKLWIHFHLQSVVFVDCEHFAKQKSFLEIQRKYQDSIGLNNFVPLSV